MAFRSLRHTLAALLVLLFLATGAAAVQVRVTPASSNGVVGSTVTVTVEADSITALGGFQFGFGYSTADLQVVSATVNSSFDQTVLQDLGAATGSGMIAATVFNNSPVGGTQITLATIDFKILNPVSGAISLANVVLGEVGGAEIPSTSVGGTVAGINVYSVTFVSGGNGTLSGSTSQTVASGGNATTVTALPNSNYHFVNWTEGAAVVSTNAALSVNSITTAHSYTANFTADPVDTTGPVLMLSTLANGAITNNATLNISGTVSDASGVASLTINAAPVAVTNGSFSHAVALQPGANISTTIAKDTLGNSTTDSRTITLDTSAPLLTVTAPADNSKTAQAVATLSGTINQASTVGVAVTVNNGSPQSATITGSSYSATVNLSAGLNTIAVIVTTTDVTGTITNAVRTLTYDSANPSLAITNPDQDITTAQKTVTVSGTVSDIITSATVALTFNNQTYTPAVTSGTFTQQLTMPANGTYPVRATATDLAGNSSSVIRNIIYAADVVAPGINSFTIPATSSALEVAISTFTASDAVGVTGYLLTENNATPSATDSAWSVLPPATFTFSTWGHRTLYAYVKDAADNISPPGSASVMIGTVDGVVVPASGSAPPKVEPELADALKSLNFAMKVTTPTPTEILHGDVAPLINGVPQPDGVINLGDTIVILRRVVGL